MRTGMATPLLFVLILGASVLPAPPAWGGDGTVQGTVSFRGEGQEGITIEVYLERKKQAGGTPFAMTESGVGGTFSLTLPPGEFYLWARERAPAFGPPKVVEYGGNPVRVRSGERTELGPMPLAEVGRGSAEPVPPETGLAGRVVIAGEPAADTSVTVYGAEARRLMGPGYVAMIFTGPDGLFQADLAPGTYRVAARKRRDGGAAGFLREGDFTGEHAGNPVTVKEGEYTAIGDLPLHEVDSTRLAQEAGRRSAGASSTRLAGRVTGPDGKPLPGQHVFLYRDQGMIGRPLKVAESGEDGAFTFDVPAGGRYYIGARSTIGGPRQPGEMAGRLAGSPDASVEVKEGETKTGLAISMEEVW
jgi:hypothetical protein